MAEMIIQLRFDPTTGKRDIVVSLRSDEGLLPQEHEELHRSLVEKLVESGLAEESQLGRLIVQRDEGTVAPNLEQREQPEERAELEESN